ncbi:hypothetical protein [Sorangium cellulosum]|uniref:Cytochrome C Planctomycete-type domain-containing protein n=1 Tax=Sorangium cellulosum So0157-2 TaxID=1254432 RepID=S4XM00_SORCE|nr:hypothetical protein [Sorangium cellulosum]AGP33466.1 hypothetical protein SCE1572_02435 [Sorangium cellulosum So0157-2]
MNVRKFFLIFVIATTGAACGGDDGPGPAETACFDYSKFDGATPEVSFATDVLPVFQRSCSFSSTCHGAEAGSAGFAYLGPAVSEQATPAQIDAIVAQNVGVPSRAPSGMPRIAAGDPANSFLMHKLDDTLSCGDLECTPDQCGAPMPYTGDTLPAAERDAVRRWIQQGAKVN